VFRHIHGAYDVEVSSAERAIRLGVLLSGSGRTLQNFIAEIAAGRLNAQIAIVVSSRAGVRGIERARSAGVPAVVVDRTARRGVSFDDAITAALADAGVELVCMAGFLSLWHIPPPFDGRVTNIHPALLPAFGGPGMYGRRVHEAVLASGATESGCTVHFADNVYDHGPIILQRRVPVLPDDSPDRLAARVLEQELIAYPEAVRLFAAGRLRVQDDICTIAPE